MNNNDFDYNRNGGDAYAGQGSAEDISGVVENLSRPRTMIYSILSLVLGIASCVLCCCGGWVGAGLGVLGIVFSVVARRHLGYFDGMSVAGLVLGICGTLFGVAFVVLGYVLDSGVLDAYLEEFVAELEQELESQYPEYGDTM